MRELSERSKNVISGLIIVGAAALAVFAAGALGSTSATNDAAQGPIEADGRIAVAGSLDTCGAGWSGGAAGPSEFMITNTSIQPMEVYLQSASSGKVFGEVEGLGSSGAATISAVLDAGSYQFVCLASDAPSILGPVVTVTGATNETPTVGILPVTRNDLYQPTQEYSAWIASRLPVLAADVAALDTAVSTGDRAASQAAWVTAHDEYEQLGAAYGAFGDFDTAINGEPAPGLTASTDPDLAGFHRIEPILWSDQSVTDAEPFATALASSVSDLQAAFTSTRLDPLDLGIRAHEILENAVQLELNGSADEVSGSTLSTLQANIAGTRQAVLPLRGILQTHGYDLATLDDWLAKSDALVQGFRGADGSWPTLAQLPRTDREKLNATLSQTVEQLAPIAAICDLRRGANT